MKRTILLASAAAFFAGCQVAPPLYYWGRYEPLTYASYTKPDKALPEEQIRLLEEDLHKAASKNAKMPPGFHAHLGYLYYRTGNVSRAVQELETEKQLFPESTAFVDQLLKGIKGTTT